MKPLLVQLCCIHVQLNNVVKMVQLSSRCIVTLLLSLLLSAVSSVLFAAENSPQRILVLHSYGTSYEWTHQLQKGIEDKFLDTNVKLSVEYLDTKRIFNEDYFTSVRQYIASKYHDYPFDAVIITDDNALTFINSLEMSNLKNLPTVAVGINNFDASLAPLTHDGLIIYEKDRIEETVELISHLRPKIKNLYYLADRSSTADYILQETQKVVKQYPHIQLVEIRDLTLDEASSLLKKVSPDDAVLLTHYNTEIAKNIYHDYNQIAEEIGSASPAPVFVFWKFYVRSGILGGVVSDSYQLGSLAADVVANKLAGKVVIPTHLETQSFATAFDYPVLLKHHIDQSLLPKGSVLIDKPESFVEANFRWLLVTCSIILVLVIIIFMLVLALGRKKIINQQNQKILSLQKNTVNVQKELIHLLGDAIETRSGETGNHVKRVAKMSSLLAKYAGLSPRECEAIEVVSPMHDIGKIGIPEAILEKPGKLEPHEWEIMKTHVDIGYKILSASEGEFLDYAAVIALEHHERWDGMGYPAGKSGEQIHLYARITTVVDVFDALMSVRCYKPAWPLEQVVALFEEQRGKQFDPRLTQLLLTHIDDFIAIRQQYPDVTTI